MLIAMLEIVFALLAAFGLVALGWLVLMHCLTPARGERESAAVVIPARRDGEALDQTVRRFALLRRWGLFRGRVVVADFGLDEDGRALAGLLCADHSGLILCKPEELPRVLSQLAYHFTDVRGISP